MYYANNPDNLTAGAHMTSKPEKRGFVNLSMYSLNKSTYQLTHFPLFHKIIHKHVNKMIKYKS